MNYTSGHEQHAVIVLLYLSEVEIPLKSAGFGEMVGRRGGIGGHIKYEARFDRCASQKLYGNFVIHIFPERQTK